MTMGGRTAAAGAVVWSAFAWQHVLNVHHESWAEALLVFAALVLVPLACELIYNQTESIERLTRWLRLTQFPAALLLAVAYLRPAGGGAAVTAAPWVLYCLLTALGGCRRLSEGRGRQPLDEFCTDIARLFLGVGGAWVFADRAGLRPLGFSEAIVALTAVHFHFAGFLLPMVAGRTTRLYPFSRVAALGAVGAILGVPAVAIGITASQLGWDPAFEAAAGCGLALGGMLIAIFQLRIAIDVGRGRWRTPDEVSAGPAVRPYLATRVLFLVSGLSLFFGMVLAVLYASRAFLVPLPWLDIPWMRALHGTINAFGFGLCSVLAWRKATAFTRS